MTLNIDAQPTNALWLRTVAAKKAKQTKKSLDLQKFNPNHEPAGTPEGGEFASAPGGGLPATTPVDPREPFDLEDKQVREDYFHAALDRMGVTEDEYRQTLRDWGYQSTEPNTEVLDHSHFQGKLDAVNAQAVVDASGGKLTLEDANHYINAWRATSTTSRPAVLQEAISEKFGIPIQSSALKDGLNVVQGLPQYDAEKEKAAAFVDAQYKVTQDYFKSQGITSVDLARGMYFLDGYPTPPAFDAVGEHAGTTGWPSATLDQNPVSSWAYTTGTAWQFAGSADRGYQRSFVLSARVPVERIFSTGITGMGDPGENEAVVLGGPLHVKAAELPATE